MNFDNIFVDQEKLDFTESTKPDQPVEKDIFYTPNIMNKKNKIIKK